MRYVFLSGFLFLFGLKSAAQCTIVSSKGWTATVHVTPVEAVPSTLDCPWFYHYEVLFNYSVTFSGSTVGREFSANIYFGCSGGTGNEPFVFLGNFTSDTSGTLITDNNARQYTVVGPAYDYGPDPSCTEIGIGDVGCNTFQLDYWGNGVPNKSSVCKANTALPIELQSFTAKRDGTAVVLRWVTATEAGNDFFSIERSRDGRLWETIAFREGAGTTAQPKTYAYTDRLNVHTSAHYRLKQTDTDGSFTYSNAVYVAAADRQATLRLSPVPADEVLVIGPAKAFDEVLIYNAHGKLLNEGVYDASDGSIHTARLPEGIYLLTARLKGKRVAQTFVVQH